MKTPKELFSEGSTYWMNSRALELYPARQVIMFGYDLALWVLPTFEKKYPSHKLVREALEKARELPDGDVSSSLKRQMTMIRNRDFEEEYTLGDKSIIPYQVVYNVLCATNGILHGNIASAVEDASKICGWPLVRAFFDRMTRPVSYEWTNDMQATAEEILRTGDKAGIVVLFDQIEDVIGPFDRSGPLGLSHWSLHKRFVLKASLVKVLRSDKL